MQLGHFMLAESIVYGLGIIGFIWVVAFLSDKSVREQTIKIVYVILGLGVIAGAFLLLIKAAKWAWYL